MIPNNPDTPMTVKDRQRHPATGNNHMETRLKRPLRLAVIPNYPATKITTKDCQRHSATGNDNMESRYEIHCQPYLSTATLIVPSGSIFNKTKWNSPFSSTSKSYQISVKMKWNQMSKEFQSLDMNHYLLNGRLSSFTYLHYSKHGINYSHCASCA